MTEQPPPRSPIKLEDLLRLKRAERPAEDFWNDFERELRAKQLAALVKKDAWWKTAFAAMPAWTRHALAPTAIAALAIVIWSAQRPATTPPATAAQATSSPQKTTVISAEPALAFATPSQPVLIAPSGNEANPLLATLQNSPRHAPIPAPAQTATMEREESVDLTRELVAATTKTEPALATLPANNQVELALLANPDDEEPTELSPRKERLVALASFSPSVSDSRASAKSGSFSRERITRRLTSEALNDSYSRLGMSGDRVLIKF